MTRQFELIRKDIAKPKLTVTPTRLTLKIPTDMTPEEERRLTAYSMWINSNIPIETTALRGRFHETGYIGLLNNQQQAVYTFSPTGGVRATGQTPELAAPLPITITDEPTPADIERAYELIYEHGLEHLLTPKEGGEK